MGILEKVVGPRSKRDKTLPFTYEAWVDILAGQGATPAYDHFFSDTLCGLISYLDEKDYQPTEALLFAVYRGQLQPLETAVCTGADGRWLARPHLCRALEERYARTGDERYRGHVDEGHCSFEDRDREGSGPVW